MHQIDCVLDLFHDLAYSCVAFFSSIIVVTLLAAYFIWRNFFALKNAEDKKKERISGYWMWMGTIFLVVVALSVASIILAAWHWPSVLSFAIAAAWGAILTYALWKLILEPLCFRISQEFSHMIGWELSDCLAIILVVPWKWFWSKLSPPANPLARPLTDAGKDPESFSG